MLYLIPGLLGGTINPLPLDDPDAQDVLHDFYYPTTGLSDSDLRLDALTGQVVAGYIYRYSFTTNRTNQPCSVSIVVQEWTNTTEIMEDTCRPLIGKWGIKPCDATGTGHYLSLGVGVVGVFCTGMPEFVYDTSSNDSCLSKLQHFSGQYQANISLKHCCIQHIRFRHRPHISGTREKPKPDSPKPDPYQKATYIVTS